MIFAINCFLIIFVVLFRKGWFCLGFFVRVGVGGGGGGGGFVQGFFVQGGFVRFFLSGGGGAVCPGGFCPFLSGGFCPTLTSVSTATALSRPDNELVTLTLAEHSIRVNPNPEPTN